MRSTLNVCDDTSKARIASLVRCIENSERTGRNRGWRVASEGRTGPGPMPRRCSKAHDVLEISISHGRRITRRLATHDDGTKPDQSGGETNI